MRTRSSAQLAPQRQAARVDFSALLTPEQLEVETLAISLLDHPDIKAARAEAVSRLQKNEQFTLPDGPATLDNAVDNLLYGSLLAAADNDPTRPKVIWSERLPYRFGGLKVPGCRYAGDSPDRIYRGIGVSTDYRYEITVRRHPTHPSMDDFSFESIPTPSMWGQAMVQLPATDIDVEQDGSFTIVADATPANGRRNHLYLPPGTKTILVRDTLGDWAREVPNEVSVRLVGDTPLPGRSRDDIARDAVEQFRKGVDLTLILFENSLCNKPTNYLSAYERSVKWGKGGGVLAFNRFKLEADEALLITLDPIGARYITLVVDDPWMCSLPYDNSFASLNNAQAQPNADGSYTFALSARDPGVYNWLDNAGLRDGVLLARWELFSEPVPVEQPAHMEQGEATPWSLDAETKVKGAVREVRVVKLRDVAALVPSGQTRIGAEERKVLLARRAAGYQVRLNGNPV